jgi:hypothetical protein
MPSILKNVEEHEGHHEGEETSCFGHSETQDGVLEELATKGRVAGDTLDQTAEDEADTRTGTSKADGGHTSALDLGGSDEGSGSRLGDASGLDVAADVVGELVAHGAQDEAVVGDLDAAPAHDGTLHTRGGYAH